MMPTLPLSARLIAVFGLWGLVAAEPVGLVASSVDDPQMEEFFETSIRPLLAEHCWECHGPETQWGGLRLDSLEALETGGDSGPAIVPGSADESLLFQAVQRSGDLQMPPDDPLSEPQIQALRYWIESGAYWPVSDSEPSSQTTRDAWKEHWAFLPLQSEPPPEPKSNHWCRNQIDCFIFEKLQENHLEPFLEADRRTLIRRVTQGLTGLPPSYEEIEAFAADPDPLAYEKLVDRLLSSPRNGEHLARVWLDVARYSDSKGYVYAREERFFVHSAAYRTWVIDSFNRDMPFDEMIRLQIAADQFAMDDPESMAAMGFLTLGRRFLGVTHDIIDDQIDVVGRGIMGLTITCARCHDHKYDPIPTVDYYSLYGVFQCSTQRQVDWQEVPSESGDRTEFQVELKSRQQLLDETMSVKRQEASDRVRERISDYLYAQSELDRYHQEGFDVILAPTDLIPAFVRRWESFLASTEMDNDPIFGPWFRYSGLHPEQFGQQASSLTDEIAKHSAIHPWVADLFQSAPLNLREVADRYGALFKRIDDQRADMSEQDSAWRDTAAPLIRVLYGPSAPCEVPDEEIVATEMVFDSATCNELWRLQGEVDRWRLQAEGVPTVAVALVDRAHLVQPRVFQRGNPARKGSHVQKGFLTFLSDAEHRAFTRGSGRAELADRLVHPSNPLTPRVWVNRLWQHLFGEGLVRTPSDFGLRADPPSHPELLDWLAVQLQQSRWSSKQIQRLIVTSATYRQASQKSTRSSEPAGTDLVSDQGNQTSRENPPAHQRVAVGLSGLEKDPENRLLWRVSPRRLSFEELRDSMLAASQDLQLRDHAKSIDLLGNHENNFLRSVYGLIDRQFLPNTLRIFDFANPDVHVGRRNQTMVPQQSLFLLNHPFVAARAKATIARLKIASLKTGSENGELQGPEKLADTVVQVFRAVLRRDPGDAELAAATDFLVSADGSTAEAIPEEALAWSYGYGVVDEELGKVAEYQELPYFSGSAWQGGTAYPDPALGWLQLNSTGGHPGNNIEHACIRRWTAPAEMTVAINSVARHEPQVSDGVRFWIISSRQGILHKAELKSGEIGLNWESIDVREGDTIDFVVDILGELNSDQFLWAPVIRRISSKTVVVEEEEEEEEGKDAQPLSVTAQPISVTEPSFSWDAKRDFRGPVSVALNPAEQLSHALLLTNEFAFVD
jgi:hypothetical protein